MPLAEVKNRLSEVVARLEREHGRVVITRHGHAAAVVMSVDEALAEMATGEAPVLSKDEALRMITRP